LRELRHVKEVGALDTEHVAEEMESLALEQRGQLEGYLSALMAYRLEYDYQRADPKTERNWRAQIRQQQWNIERWLEESPSLRAFLPEAIEHAYGSARIFAATLSEGVVEYDFPPECPYTFEQLMEKAEAE
jgi:hypothetical protein